MAYYISSGVISTGISLSDDSMHIYSGGVANSTTVNSRGSMYISSGGVANSTTINSGGDMWISSGGTATNIIASSGAQLGITVASNTYIQGTSAGSAFEMKNAYISGYTVNSDSYMSISSGGVANSTTVNYSGEMYIRSGGVANSTTVNSGGNMWIFSGGAANSTTFNSRGYMYISSGGVANSTTVNSGSMYIYSGGVANSTAVNSGGYMWIGSGGTATNIIASSGAQLGITVASDTYIQGTSAGSAFEMKNAYISGYTISGGDMRIYSGGVANSTTVNSGDNMYIENGGVADSTTVNSGGLMIISRGGVANSTTANSGGDMWIFSGGAANNTVNYGGYMSIDSGGVANSTTVSRGYMYISSGGVANSTTVNSRGYMYIGSGATHRGSLHIESGAVVSAFSGSIIDFTVSERTAEDGYLINNLALIEGTPTYTITVSENQAGGTYKLAQGAENFTGTISVGDGTVTYGSIEVNGEALQYGKVSYILAQTDGNLTLTVNGGGSVVPPIPDVEAPVMIYSGTTLVSSGTVISGAFIENGMAMLATSGGSAVITSINTGGAMYASSGAVIDSLFVASGGSATFDGATLTGQQAYAGSVVLSGTVDAENAKISLDISSRTTDSDIIINDLSLLNINTFSVTVSASQDEGIYRLAAGAENFTGTISVHILGETTSRGTISVGECISNKDESRYYTLSNNGSYLNLQISSTPGETPEVPDNPNPDLPDDPTPDDPIPDEPTPDMPVPGDAPVTIYSGTTPVSSGTVIPGASIGQGMAMFVTSGGSAAKTRVTSGGVMYASSGAVIASLDVTSGGKAVITNGTVLRGTLNFAGNVKVSGTVDASAANMHFDISGVSESTGAIVDDIAAMNADKYFITISANQTEGEYILAGNAAEFSKTVTVRSNNISRGTLTVNGAELRYNGLYFHLKEEEGTLALSVSKTGNMPELSATQNGVSFAGLIGDVDCIEFSRNNFASVLQITPSGDAIDLIGLPKGVYQWQVCSGDNAYCGENIESDNSASAQIYTSEANDINDVFFANTLFTWHAGFAAQHQGNANWQGTGESVDLSGKNQIADVFAGSTDANMLVLTDDSCGDALFLDDIFTALGEQARLSQINEIRAGAGNDIIDLTSQKFAYEGNGTTIYGGSGSDTIWANSGNNILFGDAGSDRLIGGSGDDIIIGGSGRDTMHGGGGNDTFCFGANWGKDTVEQLEDGSVTLHFENGSMDNWNAETLTYTDGNNTVKVSGVTEVTLVFGGTAPVAGAFRDAASENIFEDKTKGMIA